MIAWPMLTSARLTPSTPERAVNTARTQWAQDIPEIVAVVCIGRKYSNDLVLSGYKERWLLRASRHKKRCADKGGNGGNKADCSEWRMSTSSQRKLFLFVVISQLESLRANGPERAAVPKNSRPSRDDLERHDGAIRSVSASSAFVRATFLVARPAQQPTFIVAGRSETE
jgi:hypothetical protein